MHVYTHTMYKYNLKMCGACFSVPKHRKSQKAGPDRSISSHPYFWQRLAGTWFHSLSPNDGWLADAEAAVADDAANGELLQTPFGLESWSQGSDASEPANQVKMLQVSGFLKD